MTQTEFRLVFKRPPRLGLKLPGVRAPEQCELVLRLDPSTGLRLRLDAHRSGSPSPDAINLDMKFADQGGEGPTPYEVLLQAAMAGNSFRFTQQDGVEQTWRIMGPLLTSPPPVTGYKPGSWGPSAADALVAESGGWRDPWVES